MAYETGTATDHVDLYAKLKAFLTTNADLVAAGHNWSVVWTPPAGAPNDTDVVLKAPGPTGTDQIYVGLRRVDNPTVNSYFIRMVGMTGVNPNASTFRDHVNVSPEVTTFVDPNAMKYWFVANGRRFIAVIKISTVYEAMYGGFFLPYSDPLSFPYPMFIGGSAGPNFTSPYNWTNTQSGHSHFVSPCGSENTSPNNEPGAYFLDPSVQWLDVDNGFNRVSTSEPVTMAPYKWNGGLGTILTEGYITAYTTLLDRTVECLGGGYTIQPVSIVQSSPTNQTWGVLDGVYHVPGEGNAAENIITVNGIDHLVVQNVYRTSPYSYWALALA